MIGPIDGSEKALVKRECVCIDGLHHEYACMCCANICYVEAMLRPCFKFGTQLGVQAVRSKRRSRKSRGSIGL